MQITDDGCRKMDTVEDTRVLMDAGEFAGATGRPLEIVDGRSAVRIEDAAALCFSPPIKDLRPYDQVVAVYRTGRQTVRPQLNIELTTRTEGLTSNDAFNTGSGAVTSFENVWGEYPFPASARTGPRR